MKKHVLIEAIVRKRMETASRTAEELEDFSAAKSWALAQLAAYSTLLDTIAGVKEGTITRV